ncbi:S8 family serine peptidase [Chitinophaga oryziterrae]|uniref:S8 family serine peptidase n=2 Tax=Chitinophaga oryziterrae TaxID=1031224 RepID=A0A6N8J6A1_9BACT|nr:S8 family serine peptidase [Chitinophaga oryziterrae]
MNICKKTVISITFLFSGFIASAQVPNWQNMDLQKDSVFGISVEKAYTELLKDKKAKPVVVAIIDSGIDTAHEDLKNVLWVNLKEKRGNGKDDDKNHYIDDINGWSFIGSAKGNVNYDNLELTRLIRQQKTKFDTSKDTTGLYAYSQMRVKFDEQLQEAQQTLTGIGRFMQILDSMLVHMKNPNPTAADVDAYATNDPAEQQVKQVIGQQLPRYPDFKTFKEKELDGAVDHFKEQVDYQLNLDFDPRAIVGDNYGNPEEHYYGSSDVTGPGADHGTHVAGIIGAARNNNIGINGIADDVLLMSVRAVPNGDERDKDIANAIRYAADNGAKVVNMSFGKPYSPNKKVVDEAVQYAMSKDVLLIHAAGNDGANLDSAVFYPNRVYAGGKGTANAWIEVGASGPGDDESLVAPFSNYSKTGVDVFAPGVAIYSSTPGSHYDYHDGTSMAAPVVTGLAALIRSYYPKLSAVQVKDIILKSVSKVTHPVTIYINGEPKMVQMTDVCNTGGVVNAYNALKLAATY